MMTGQKLIPLPPEQLLYVGRDATQGKKYSYEHKLSLVIYLLRLNPRRRDCRVVQFNLRVTLGFRLDEYLSSPPINHTVLTSGRVINTALDWCEIKNAIVLSIRVVVVLLVLEGTEAHQPRSSASAF